jgi:hypothetical protein
MTRFYKAEHAIIKRKYTEIILVKDLILSGCSLPADMDHSFGSQRFYIGGKSKFYYLLQLQEIVTRIIKLLIHFIIFATQIIKKIIK